jgi:hypothetical protein
MVYRIALDVCALCLIAAAFMAFTGKGSETGPLIIATFAALAQLRNLQTLLIWV